VRPRPFIHFLALAAAALAVSACATATLTRLAYNNATIAYGNLGPMLAWMVDDYVDLSGTQEDWVRGRIAATIEWHRTQELPRYRGFLESVLAKSAAPFATEDLASHQQELRAHYRRVLDRVVPDTAQFFSNLDAEQVAQMERKFASDNRKFARESVSGTPEERLDRRKVRFVNHLEAWVGPLSEEQRNILAQGYARLPDFASEMLGERRYRQGEILGLARARPPREEMERQLRRLLVETETWRRPEYLERLRERDRHMFQMLAALSATLSAEQRTTLQNRIRGFLRDITTLTAAT
jgi:uncharacterized protein DUF6279